jgi:hypothetical protein
VAAHKDYTASNNEKQFYSNISRIVAESKKTSTSGSAGKDSGAFRGGKGASPPTSNAHRRAHGISRRDGVSPVFLLHSCLITLIYFW